MLDFWTVLKTRRSVREFLSKEIDAEQIEFILRGGMQAPSAKNQQIWEFIVINDRLCLNEIAKRHPYGQMLTQAPLSILVVGNLDKVTSQLYAQDLAAATQNILLSATALGLGSCWMGLYSNKERMGLVREVFNLPPQIIPFSLIAIGYPKNPDDLRFIDRFNPDLVHLNRW